MSYNVETLLHAYKKGRVRCFWRFDPSTDRERNMQVNVVKKINESSLVLQRWLLGVVYRVFLQIDQALPWQESRKNGTIFVMLSQKISKHVVGL